MLGGIGFLLYTSPTPTLLMLTAVPPVAVGAMIYANRIRRLSSPEHDALPNISQSTIESLSRISTSRRSRACTAPRRAGAARRRPPDRARRDRRGGRPVGRRQVHHRVAARALLRPAGGPRAVRRARPPRHRSELAAPPHRHRRAGAHPLLH